MNGVIITTAIREKECAHALKLACLNTPKPCVIILMHAPGKPELDQDWPAALAKKWGVLYEKMPVGGSGGLTAAWNFGFRRLLAEGCDSIVCMNDDVYVDETWGNLFDVARENPTAVVGPVSKNPGVDYTNLQLQQGPSDETWVFNQPTIAKRNGKPYFCVNGFCFALSASLCHDLTMEYGDVLDHAGYAWGGQEEDLGRRILKMGGQVVVTARTYVNHLKFSDWRKHGLHSYNEKAS